MESRNLFSDQVMFIIDQRELKNYVKALWNILDEVKNESEKDDLETLVREFESKIIN